MPKINIKTLSIHEFVEAIKAVEERSTALDWYVLKYNIFSSAYENKIKFKTLAKAWEEFNETFPEHADQRIELMFSPQSDDPEFKDNIVINYKTQYTGKAKEDISVDEWDKIRERLDTEVQLKNYHYCIDFLNQVGVSLINMVGNIMIEDCLLAIINNLNYVNDDGDNEIILFPIWCEYKSYSNEATFVRLHYLDNTEDDITLD